MITQSRIRFLLLSTLFVLGVFLFNLWQQEHPDVVRKTKVAAQAHHAQSSASNRHELPEVAAAAGMQPQAALPAHAASGNEAHDFPAERLFEVDTDVLTLKIDRLGGDIVEAYLPQFDDNKKNPPQRFQLLGYEGARDYVVQSGLLSKLGPDAHETGKALFSAPQMHYSLPEGQDKLVVALHYQNPHYPLQVTKQFTFYRGKYDFDVEYLVSNEGDKTYQGTLYGRLKRTASENEGSGFLGVQTYTGAAINTPERPYQKITFKDIEKKEFEKTQVIGGWAAMIEHYFLSAWIPPKGESNTYDTQSFQHEGRQAYGVQFYSAPLVVKPHEQGQIGAKAYLGPLITEDLQGLSPGLELTVDYGIFWPICKPIFWLLKKIQHLTGNWGVAIILTTLVIKLLFYRLSASSYRSMGNMKRIQPKVQALKERCGDDRQKFGQAVMELYRKEKVNPLGGCLPILIQIPVFIALYYVLLGSVELRQAPFLAWITDLSVRDPYYVLPILMGITMLVQQKMNPAPPDPMQAKVMMMMPVIFTALFLQFPAGLVLYWVVNNLLSMLQQWYIARGINRAAVTHTKSLPG